MFQVLLTDFIARPLFVYPRAHGVDPSLKLSETSAEQNPDPSLVPPPQPRWITALRTLPYSDLFVSGSWDGHIRVWRLSDDKKKFELLGTLGSSTGLPASNGVDGDHAADLQAAEGHKILSGIVNDIAVFERGDRGRDGLCLVAATGKEIRLGRWKVVKGGKCGATVFEVPRTVQSKMNGAEASEDEDEGDDGDGDEE